MIILIAWYNSGTLQFSPSEYWLHGSTIFSKLQLGQLDYEAILFLGKYLVNKYWHQLLWTL